ncbi:MAG: phosphoribosylanthranilate isomerase [Steroidobacteraceae bacterium]|nr:phosphoribosylanthranilate isomerase [Steroidobacteraceae bacterium]MDW8260080.1 phosphoribosylanthranilate isomerase [Gammaproteobacteria bacterium]
MTRAPPTAPRGLWIKICGMTDAAAVEAALAAGADAIGFVFAPSVRRVSIARAAQLAAAARGRLTIVAVMQHPTEAEWRDVWQGLQPDLLQTDHEDLSQLTARCPTLPVLRSAAAAPAELPATVLFESARSGSGCTADWDGAARLARRTRLVLAGGLHAQNVAAAIARVAPWGVDVSSGVEAEPGRKSPQLIREFVAAARAAAGAD